MTADHTQSCSSKPREGVQRLGVTTFADYFLSVGGAEHTAFCHLSSIQDYVMSPAR